MNEDMIRSNIVRRGIRPEESQVQLIMASYGKTVSGKKGTEKGPEAIISMLDYQLEEYDRILKKTVCDDVIISQFDFPARFPQLKPVLMAQKVKKQVLWCLKNGIFPVVLGGEHTVSLGALEAVLQFYGAEITLLDGDAHRDLRGKAEYSKKGWNLAHSSWLRHVRDRFKFPIVQFGIRSAAKEEDDYADSQEDFITFDDFYRGNPWNMVEQIPTELVYFSLDMDVFDFRCAPSTGTGTTEPGGWSWYDMLYLIKALYANKKVVCCDLVEVIPDDYTEYVAAKLLYHQIGRKFCN